MPRLLILLEIRRVPLTMSKRIQKKLLTLVVSAVTKLFKIAVNNFDAKKSDYYSWVLVVTILVVHVTQYISLVSTYVVCEDYL